MLDLDQLKNEFSTEVVEGTKERYRLEWPGKKEAIVTANLPTTKTLRPVKVDSVDFDNTENLYIEGDNLEVLKCLQESYFGKIKMIYIDPPYNTGSDFIYKDNYSRERKIELEESGQIDEENNRLFENTDASGMFHTSWLNMMYPRLKLARNLLSKDGVIFISIDENEITNMRKLCDEIWGEENHITTLHVQMSSVQGQKVKAAKKGNIVKNAEYILVYGKSGNKAIAKNVLYETALYDTHYSLYLEPSGDSFTDRTLSSFIMQNADIVKALTPLGLIKNNNITNKNIAKAYNSNEIFRDFIHIHSNSIVRDDNTSSLTLPPSLRLEPGIVVEHQAEDRSYLITVNSQGTVRQRIKLSEKINQAHNFLQTYGCTTIRGDWWPEFNKDLGNVSKEGSITFSNGKKPKRLIKQLAYMLDLKPNDKVLDFFSGSATTAHSIMELNNEEKTNINYIMVQAPAKPELKKEASDYKNICEIGKERIRRAGAKIKEETGADIDYGFRVYRLDESNMADVYHTPQDYDQNNLELFADNVKEGRTADDLLAQIMLDWGLPLSLPIEETTIAGKRVFNVAGNSLMACFETGIDEAFAKQVAEEEPLRIVFKDAGFSSDTAKSNVKQLLKQLSPETEMKVI